MSAPTSRSPSPAQAPPIQQTPGPRAAALQKLYSDAISHTLRTCSYSNFASSFPTPASHAPDAMKRLHTDFVEKLHRTCKLNFDQILRDRQVVASLNDLDRLVEDARKRKTAAEQATNGQPVQPPLSYVSPKVVARERIVYLRDFQSSYPASFVAVPFASRTASV